MTATRHTIARNLRAGDYIPALSGTVRDLTIDAYVRVRLVDGRTVAFGRFDAIRVERRVT